MSFSMAMFSLTCSCLSSRQRQYSASAAPVQRSSVFIWFAVTRLKKVVPSAITHIGVALSILKLNWTLPLKWTLQWDKENYSPIHLECWRRLFRHYLWFPVDRRQAGSSAAWACILLGYGQCLICKLTGAGAHIFYMHARGKKTVISGYFSILYRSKSVIFIFPIHI